MPTPTTSFEPIISLASQALTSFDGAASRAEAARKLKIRLRQLENLTVDPEIKHTCKILYEVLDVQEKHHMDAGNLMQMLIRHLEAEQGRVQKMRGNIEELQTELADTRLSIKNRLERIERILQPVTRVLSWFSRGSST